MALAAPEPHIALYLPPDLNARCTEWRRRRRREGRRWETGRLHALRVGLLKTRPIFLFVDNLLVSIG